jgi:hypothetical protein
MIQRRAYYIMSRIDLNRYFIMDTNNDHQCAYKNALMHIICECMSVPKMIEVH